MCVQIQNYFATNGRHIKRIHKWYTREKKKTHTHPGQKRPNTDPTTNEIQTKSRGTVNQITSIIGDLSHFSLLFHRCFLFQIAMVCHIRDEFRILSHTKCFRIVCHLNETTQIKVASNFIHWKAIPIIVCVCVCAVFVVIFCQAYILIISFQLRNVIQTPANHFYDEIIHGLYYSVWAWNTHYIDFELKFDESKWWHRCENQFRNSIPVLVFPFAFQSPHGNLHSTEVLYFQLFVSIQACQQSQSPSPSEYGWKIKYNLIFIV